MEKQNSAFYREICILRILVKMGYIDEKALPHIIDEMKRGIIVLCEREAETVKRIFCEYIDGLVLQDIAESLKRRKIEYLPGESDWNKNRVKRMIDDIRYCGNGKYPAVISLETYNAAKLVKAERSTVNTYTLQKEDKPVIKNIRCSCCGGKLRHITNNRNKKNEHFVCDDCRLTVFKAGNIYGHRNNRRQIRAAGDKACDRDKRTDFNRYLQ